MSEKNVDSAYTKLEELPTTIKELVYDFFENYINDYILCNEDACTNMIKDMLAIIEEASKRK